MNTSIIPTPSSPPFVVWHAMRQARMISASILGMALVLLEFWLRVPIKPVLDLYWQDVLAGAATISACACRTRAHAR